MPANRPTRQRRPRRTARDTSLAVGGIFRKARRLQGLSQEQVAAMTRGRPGQISRAMVSLIERGRHLPGLEAAVALTRALNVEPMDIFEQVDLSTLEMRELPHRDVEELRRQATELSWAGEHRRALVLCNAMLRLIGEDGAGDALERARQEALIEIHRASALRHCGALGAARTAAERAVSLAEPHAEIQAQGYILLASLYERRGLRVLARDMAARAIELAEGGEARLRGMAWMQMGSALAASKKYEAARRAFLQARGFIREAGDRNHEIHIEGNLGACLAGLERRQQARQRYARAVELARRHDVPASEAFWLVEVGRVALDGGAAEEADRCAARALLLARPRSLQLTVFRAECLRHRVRQRRGTAGRDHRRVARLRRLYSGLRDHAGVEEVEWFRKTVLETELGRRRPPGGSEDES